MVNDVLMNDTLDNFNFSQNGKLIAPDGVRIIDTQQSTQDKNEPNCSVFTSKLDVSCISTEISFDDSIFLSQLSSLEEKKTICNNPKERSKNVTLKEITCLPLKNNSSTSINSLLQNYNRNGNVTDRISTNSNTQVIAFEQNPHNCNAQCGLSNKFKDVVINRENSSITIDNRLSSLGLPTAILEKYESRKLYTMFQWQVECLRNVEVLSSYKNLVYSAPTSAGKTLVAEILAIKTVLERQKKVIIILPFVSIVREKMFYFQDILGSSGIRVEGFMGSYNPPGGFTSVQIAICTIEKANNLINRLLEEGNLYDIGTILVDEIHLLGDPSRGYLLELLLTKLKYISKKDENVAIQIVGMSATLPNLEKISNWLDAELYTTDYRPIPLYEQALVCGEIYDKNLKLVKKLSPLPEFGVDTDYVLQLCLETIKESSSVLIFCPTKNWCENLARQLSTAFHKIGSSRNIWGEVLRCQLNTNSIMELLEQLKYCPIGLDEILCKTVSFGVAFHHAGLTMDERDIIEGGFRNGALRVLVATSTLSSGVNLPARRVIIRTPNFHSKPIDPLTYRQMIGRAGRMGKDSVGESFLICQKSDYKIAKELMSAILQPVESCLEGTGKLKRAILEVIASGVASSPEDVDLFTQCTLLAAQDNGREDLNNPINEAITFLKNNEFIRLQKQENGEDKFIATSLGKACLSSSMPPDEGLTLFTELEKARQCFVLESELHLIYLVTPYSACYSWGNIDWMFYLELWEKLPKSMKKVGELVGVRESYIVNATRGNIQTNSNKLFHKLLVHKRFFVALALQDIVSEKPLGWVCSKFNCNRGMLQSLQLSASSFAGMVTSFSRQLGWSSVELLISQFQDRLQFGVSRDLLDLMHIPLLNGKLARILYNSGIQTISQLANSKIANIESILYKAIPFESKKEREGETEFDNKQRNKFRNIWIPGKEGLTEAQAAQLLVQEARQYLKLEMGLAEAKWEVSYNENDSLESNNKENLVSNTNQKLLNSVTCSKVEESRMIKTSLLQNDKSEGNLAVQNVSNDSLFSNSSIMSSNGNTGKRKDTEIEKHSIIENNISESSLDNLDNSNSSYINREKSLKNNLALVSYEPNKTYMLTKTINKNEVSQFLSPSSVELNISSSSIFSVSPNNLNISIEQIDSDQSLFDDSFNLQLTRSNETSFDSGIKDDIIKTKQCLDNLSEPFNNDENKINILNTSVEDEYSSRKRKTNTSQVETPSKKAKIIGVQTDTKINRPNNTTYFENKLSTTCSDLSKIEIVDICKDLSLINLFAKEVKQQKCISLSLACCKILKTKQIIGLNKNDANTNDIPFSHKDRKLNGFAISWGANNVFYLSLENSEFAPKIIRIMKSLLSNTNLRVKMFDSKEQLKALKYCCHLDFRAKVDDPKIADWILEPENNEKNLQAMTVEYCPEGVKLSQLCGNCKGLGSIGLDLFSSIDSRIRASVESLLTWYIVDSIKDVIQTAHSNYLDIYDIETETILCLARMEISGISVSKEKFQKLEGLLKTQIAAIEKIAFCLAGRNFNFLSSSDVAKVIGLSKGRKVSTRKQILEHSEHPLSDLILLWRKLNATLTKSIYPLIRMIENDHIKGCYVTHTATGRISMHEPNLQNIAKDFTLRNPLTKENITISCRAAFKVSDGFCLVSADYCQLELRILTHLSQDNLLCNVMKKPGDVFKFIAAKWYKVDEDQVDDSMRQNTKHICYGIIYGMGSKALSEQLLLDENEANRFIMRFKGTYPGLQIFIKKIIENCEKQGYVTTITGRKRFLPHINDPNTTKKGQAERQAVNTVVQGSAADISKKAMILVERELREIFHKTKKSPKLVLHLHDELMYEVPVKYVRKVAKVIKKNMEDSVQLSVPFPVKLKTGDSWGTMTEYNL